MSYRREPKVNAATWVVVADAARALVLETEWSEMTRLTVDQELHHEEGTALASEVLTDRPGRFSGPGHMRQSGDPDIDFRRQTLIDFAVRIVEVLEQGRNQNRFGRLILVAAPTMLGVLRERISSPLAKLVVHELGKDYVQLPPKELHETLHEHLSELTMATAEA